MASRHRSPPTEEEYQSSGFVGLVRAVERFDSGKGVKFSTYADHVVRGEMIDAVRREDRMTRNTREHNDDIEDVKELYLAVLGRLPEEHEMCKYLNRNPRRFRQLRMRIAAQGKQNSLSLFFGPTSLYHPAEVSERRASGLKDAKAVPPFRDVEEADTWNLLMRGLSDRKRLIVILTFRAGWSMRRIGSYLGISETRVSQVMDEIKRHMRETATAHAVEV